MSTISQVIFNYNVKKKKKISKLQKNPQKKGICLKVLTMSPKKPNSANRRIVKTNIIQFNSKITVKIPGESHNLQLHSSILVHGARIRDLIGVNHSAIRGKLDLQGVVNRKTRRSLFGVKKNI